VGSRLSGNWGARTPAGTNESVTGVVDYSSPAMEGSINDVDRAFGDSLRRALDESDLTAVQLADRLNVTERSLRRYMSSQRRPDEGIVAKWESICESPPGLLLDAYRALPPKRGKPSQQPVTEVRPPVGSSPDDTGEGERRGSRALGWPIAAVLGLIVVAVLATMLVFEGCGPTRGVVEAPRAQSPRPDRREVVTVDNRVTRGLNMGEDPTPLRLTTKPWINCLIRECAIGGTERTSGETYDAAICWKRGERTTNGDDSSTADDDNPNLHTSTRYYQVQLADDTYGYVSEVWLTRRDRGGLDLPPC